MAPFSTQIREAIKASCVSRYAIAEQCGISESVLSRFMSDKHNISLSTLDKIAAILGLEVIVGISGVHKSRKRGRPKKENPKKQKAKRLTVND